MSEQGELAGLRQRIDALDDELLRLLSQRAQCAQQVAEVKQRAGDDAFYRPEREAQVLRRLAAANPGPLPEAAVTGIFREIMSACLALERPLTVAYLGPPGTFSQDATQKHFGQAVNCLPQATIEQVFREVDAGAADYGVVPIENSTEGAVTHTLDMFLHSPLKVCGEVELAVHQQLLSHAQDMAGIRVVYSHAQSLAQCRRWLAGHLFFEPVSQHDIHTAVDALIKRFSVQVQADFQRVKGVFGKAVGLPVAGGRQPGGFKHLKRPDNAEPVVGMNPFRCLGIAEGKPLMQNCCSFSIRLLFKPFQNGPVGRVRSKQPVQAGLDVKAGAADKERQYPLPVQIRQNGPGHPRVSPGAEGLVRIRHVNHVMGHPGLFGRGGLGRADVHAPVNLHGVRPHNLAAEFLGKGKGKAGLAHAGGAAQHDHPGSCRASAGHAETSTISASATGMAVLKRGHVFRQSPQVFTIKRHASAQTVNRHDVPDAPDRFRRTGKQQLIVFAAGKDHLFGPVAGFLTEPLKVIGADGGIHVKTDGNTRCPGNMAGIPGQTVTDIHDAAHLMIRQNSSRVKPGPGKLECPGQRIISFQAGL